MNTDIPIPKRLQKRPKFHGIPIPFTALIRPDGTPDFKVTDRRSWNACVTANRCGLCGEKLLKKQYYFIGGELSCQSGIFYDPPMHRECAEYAFKVCPFLACQKGYSKAPMKPIKGIVIVTDPNMPTQRPARMAILCCQKKWMVCQGGRLYFKADDVLSIDWKD